MKDLRSLDHYRARDASIRETYGSFGDEGNGAFVIPHRSTGVELKVIASNGDGWDHVSVSLRHRCPNWIEMSYIARLFFRDDEFAMQLHVPGPLHINLHPNCLHWWRPHNQLIPLPPKEFV